MSPDSQTRMTNDEIRKNDQIQMTKPATAQLRAIGHSGFGFLSSFVIQRLMQIRFIVPMRAEKASDPSVNRTTPGPSQEGSEPSSAPVPLLGGVRGGFMVPMRARSERRLSMNRPTPDPSEEGSRRRSASCQFPSWEGLGVGSWSQCMRIKGKGAFHERPLRPAKFSEWRRPDFRISHPR